MNIKTRCRNCQAKARVYRGVCDKCQHQLAAFKRNKDEQESVRNYGMSMAARIISGGFR